MVQNRDFESRRRRALAKQLRVGQWAAVEDPDENPFWLAKIAEQAYQHTGNSIEASKTDIAFVKNYWYIKVHVYKPNVSQAPGGYSFLKMGSEPARCRCERVDC